MKSHRISAAKTKGREALASRGPHAREERVASRAAYSDIGAPAARRLLMADYGSVLAGVSANPAATIATQGKVVRYLDDYTAQVRTPAGLEVETSTAPLRVGSSSGRKAPVDLSLESGHGPIEPKQPLSPVAIGESASEGIALPAAGISLTMLGSDAAATMIEEKAVFYGEVAEDTDAVAAPKLNGADLSTVLRSTDSPEQLRYRVGMPLGAKLAAEQGGAVIRRGKVVLGRIPAPSARDAQGTPVPVEMQVHGDELLVDVPHRQRSYAYPILVDPELLVEITENPEGWEYSPYTEFTSHEGPWLGHSTKSGPFEHSEPGTGSPLSLTIDSAELPFEEEFSEAGPENWVATEFVNRQFWYPEVYSTIFAIYFDGISSSGNPGPAAFTQFKIGACEQEHTWSASEIASTSFAFFPTAYSDCSDYLNGSVVEPSPVVVKVTSGTTVRWEWEEGSPYHAIPGERITVGSANISVAAIVVARPLTWEEEEEFDLISSESYGNGNPAQLSNTDCMAGDPVNCATGNLVETQKDLSVGGIGPGMEMTRTYNSQLAATQRRPGEFGYGWTGSYGDQIEVRRWCRFNCEEISASSVDGIGLDAPEGEFEAASEGEGEVFEELAIVHQDNGSTAEFRRIEGEPSWTPINPLTRAELASEGEEFLYTLPDQTLLRFDSSGLLAAVEDRNGNALSVHRDGEGRIASVSDESGRELAFSYDPEGFVESIEVPMGHVVHYEYEGENLLSVSQADSAEPKWQFTYDHDHELTSVTDARGGVTRTKYRSFRAVEQRDPMGRVTRWAYSPSEEGSTTTISEPNGSETVEGFNEGGLISSVTRASGTPLAATTTYEYNPADELTAVTNPEEQTTEFAYDANGDRTSEVDPLEQETKWTYNEAHQFLSETTPSGEKTTITRDANGSPETVSRPAPESKTQTVSYEYGPHGELEVMTDPLGNTWVYEYDSHGDLRAEIDPEGGMRSWTYDENSRVVSATSPRGNQEGAEAGEFTTSIERDPQGRPLRITDPLEGATKYAYDPAGNLESITDPNGRKTKFSYDADNERVKVERPNGAIEETGYDDAGKVTSQTDGVEGETTYVRNLLEQPVEVIDPLERTTTQTFDAAGNLKTKEDPDGRTTTFTFDSANRLKEISYSDGMTPNTTFGYDNDGNLTTMSDGSGESTFEYDQLDRLTHSEDGNGDSVSWEYNLGNEPVGLTYPNGKSISRAYDKAGRLESVTDWLGHTTSFAYNKDSELKATTFPAGTGDLDEFAFDRADRMSGVTMKKGVETLASLSYARDKAGQLESLISKGLPGAEEESFAYDENERLKSAGAGSYEYDDANNLTKAPGTTNAYDKASQLESTSGATFAYDEEGERTKRTPSSGPATTYKYDQAGNLTAIERPEEGETPAVAESFAYNGTGLLTSRTVGLSTQHLTWDSSEALPLLLSDGENSYVYGPNGLAVEQISSEEVPTYLHHDQLGSTRLLTDSAGEATGTFTYGVYGALTGHTGSATSALGYAGQYTLGQSGLQYLRARMFDPATGQFLTRDPLSSITLEPYAYAGDNPTNGVDPSGLSDWNPFSSSFWTEGNFISESPLNPIPYYEAEIESWESGCGYWSSVLHGFEGAAVATADASIVGGLAEGASRIGESAPEIDEANASHIFRDAPSHLAEDTLENRMLLEDAVKPENYVFTRPAGTLVYHETLSNGEQVWVEVYDGRITNGGVNEVP